MDRFYSTSYLNSLIDKLKQERYQDSTKENYYQVWKVFNEFVVKLDTIPDKWEDRFSLYCAFMIYGKGLQSSTIKSYKSAVKAVLTMDGYMWDDDLVLMSTFTKNCKMKTDKVIIRIPIRSSLLDLMLLELERIYDDQPFLEKLYKAIFSTMYHGLMRISETAKHKHAVKVADVHIAKDNRSAKLILRSSKTHTIRQKPQVIIIKSTRSQQNTRKGHSLCPVKLLKEYAESRSAYKTESEQFFVFSDKTPVTARNVRVCIKQVISRLGIDSKFYDTHSFRIGRATDLKKAGHKVESIKEAGRWKSNAVYDYLR